MATGPEHYKEAGRLLGWWAQFSPAERKAIRRNRRHGATPLAEGLAAAQVHATLALAAATALASHDEYDDPDHVAWHDAASLSDPEDPEATP